MKSFSLEEAPCRKQTSFRRPLSSLVTLAMSSKLAAVALVLLFGCMLAGVDADPVAKQHTESNWLSVPYEYLRHAYSEVEKAAAEFSKTPFSTEARNHVTSALDKLNALFYQPPA